MQAGHEIKFRALGVDGDLHYFDIYDIVSPPDEDGVFYVRSNLGILIAVEEGTEQQFTGLRDKNGQEIYEKDIWLPQGSDTPRVIVWHRYGWWFKYPNGGVTRPVESTEDGEIIGNIFENPELLQQVG